MLKHFSQILAIQWFHSMVHQWFHQWFHLPAHFIWNCSVFVGLSRNIDASIFIVYFMIYLCSRWVCVKLCLIFGSFQVKTTWNIIHMFPIHRFTICLTLCTSTWNYLFGVRVYAYAILHSDYWIVIRSCVLFHGQH